MERRLAHRASVLGLVAFLVVLLSTLLGCRRVLQPLDDREPSPVQEPDGPTPVLVRIVACWPAFPLAEDLVAAYAADHPNALIDLAPASSSVARGLVAAGRVDMAIVGEMPDSRGPTRSSRDDSSSLVSEPLALDAIGVIVHADSSLREVSVAELASLFAGYRLDWEELGAGQGRPEILIREEGSAMRRAFDEIVMGQQTVSSASVVLPHDNAILEYVAEHPRAIGYLSKAYVDDRVRLVAIDGFEPTRDEIRRGRYPLVYPLAILLSPKAPAEASCLSSFALSSKGRDIVEQRYVPHR